MPWEIGTHLVRPEGPRESGSTRNLRDWKLSRPFRPHPRGLCLPRASACGLSPGLRSLGPLGRTWWAPRIAQLLSLSGWVSEHL